MSSEKSKISSPETIEQNTHRSVARETNAFSNKQLLMRFENIHRLGTKKVVDSVIRQDSRHP